MLHHEVCIFWSELSISYSITTIFRLKSFFGGFFKILSKKFLSEIRFILISITGPRIEVFCEPRYFTTPKDWKYLSDIMTRPRLSHSVGIMNLNKLTGPGFKSSNWVGQTGPARKIYDFLSQIEKYLSTYFMRILNF